MDAPELWDRPPTDVVNVKNGLLRISDKTLLPHSPDYLSPIQLPVTYDPTATCPETEKFVGEVFPSDATCLAWEIVAYLMLAYTFIQKAILLVGPGGNGKSTWLPQVIAFLGKGNERAKPMNQAELEAIVAKMKKTGRLNEIFRPDGTIQPSPKAIASVANGPESDAEKWRLAQAKTVMDLAEKYQSESN